MAAVSLTCFDVSMPRACPALSCNHPLLSPCLLTRTQCQLPSSLRFSASAQVRAGAASSNNDNNNTFPSAPADISILGFLKEASLTKQPAAKQVIAALIAIQNAPPQETIPTTDAELVEGLWGSKAPGKAWQLIFTTNGKTDPAAATGSYSPLPARYRFNASEREFELAVVLGPLGYITFKGPLNIRDQLLFFLLHSLTLKLGPLPPLQIAIAGEGTRRRVPGEGTEGEKDPCFTWLVVSNDVIVAKGRGGGVALWRKYEGDFLK